MRDALDMAPYDYRIMLGGVMLGGATIQPDHVLAIDTGEASPTPSSGGEETRDPSFNCPAIWIDKGNRDHATADGFLVVDPGTVVATHLNQLLAARAA